MKGVLVIALAIVLAGCQPGADGKAGNPGEGSGPIQPSVTTTKIEGATVPGMEGLQLASAISNGNVTVYPVTASKKSMRDLDDMMTLDEAKRKGFVEIVEQPDEQVEELEVINKGPKAIFLMAGEVLLGGKQDRIVAKDTVVKPGETVKVPVYCVDQGRWEGGESFAPSAKFAPTEVRRAAAVEKDQGLVWDKVAAANATIAGTYDVDLKARAGDSLKKSLDSKALKEREKDADALSASILKDPNVVGVVTVVNGNIQGFEYFGSNKFLGKALPAIMRGVVTDSMVEGQSTKGSADAKSAAAFVAECLSGKNTRDGEGGGFCYFKTDGINHQGVYMSKPQAGGKQEVYRGSFFNSKKK